VVLRELVEEEVLDAADRAAAEGDLAGLGVGEQRLHAPPLRVALDGDDVRLDLEPDDRPQLFVQAQGERAGVVPEDRRRGGDDEGVAVGRLALDVVLEVPATAARLVHDDHRLRDDLLRRLDDVPRQDVATAADGRLRDELDRLRGEGVRSPGDAGRENRHEEREDELHGFLLRFTRSATSG
jgi:hypothetical protein